MENGTAEFIENKVKCTLESVDNLGFNATNEGILFTNDGKVRIQKRIRSEMADEVDF